MTRMGWLILLLAAALVATLIAVLLLIRNSSEPSAGTAQDVQRALRSQRASPLVMPAVDSAIDRTISLPPRNMPLAQVLSQLERQALAGSSKAACRLSQDIRRCANMSASLDLAETLSAVPVLPGKKQTVAEELLTQSQDEEGFCANVPVDVLDKGYEFQRAAANSGNKAYERWLVLAPALSQQDFLSDIDGWQDYRQRAGKYVSEALANRSGEDFFILLGVYAPQSVTGIKPPYHVDDDRTFLALVKVAQQHQLNVPAEIKQAADRMFESIGGRELSLVDLRTAELGSGWRFNPPPAFPHEEVGKASSDSFCR